MNEIELIKEQLKKIKDLKLNSNPNVIEHLLEKNIILESMNKTTLQEILIE